MLCPPTKYLRYLEKPLKTIISYCLWKTGCTGTTPLCSPETYIQLPVIFCLVLYCINSLLEKSPSPAILPPTKSLRWPCQTVFLNRKLKHTGYLFSLFKYGCYLGLNFFFKKNITFKSSSEDSANIKIILHLTAPPHVINTMLKQKQNFPLLIFIHICEPRFNFLHFCFKIMCTDNTSDKLQWSSVILRTNLLYSVFWCVSRASVRTENPCVRGWEWQDLVTPEKETTYWGKDEVLTNFWLLIKTKSEIWINN